jgi:LEA14-like dessication related protein
MMGRDFITQEINKNESSQERLEPDHPISSASSPRWEGILYARGINKTTDAHKTYNNLVLLLFRNATHPNKQPAPSMDLIGGIGKAAYRATTFDPKVTVIEIVPHPNQLELGVKLSVDNRNLFPMEVRSVSYTKVTKASDGTVVAEGSTDEVFAIPKESAKAVELPVHCTWTGVKAIGSSLYNKGETELRVNGQVTVHSTVMGNVLIPYAGSVNVVWG